MGSLPLLLGLFNAPHTEGKLSFFWITAPNSTCSTSLNCFSCKKTIHLIFNPFLSWVDMSLFWSPHTMASHIHIASLGECVAVIITRQRFLFVEWLPSVRQRHWGSNFCFIPKFSPIPNTSPLQIANYISVNSDCSPILTEASLQIYNKN